MNAKDIDARKLLSLAREARTRAYAPYSHFSVGACLLCASGRTYTGCNIENLSFGATVCAERVALFRAISEGEREFLAIAVVGGREDDTSPCMPCGICRQVMAELCPKEFSVILCDGEEEISYSLSELLPMGFEASL